MKENQVIRKELLALLKGGNAHMRFDEAVADFPPGEINRKVPNGNYTIWHLLEHMRIAQEDILRYTLDPGWKSPLDRGERKAGMPARTSKWTRAMRRMREASPSFSTILAADFQREQYGDRTKHSQHDIEENCFSHLVDGLAAD